MTTSKGKFGYLRIWSFDVDDDNAFIEAFNGRFRAERRQGKDGGLTQVYNEVRAHSAIGQKVPIALLNHDGATSPPS